MPARGVDWAQAFARQAVCDLKTRQVLALTGSDKCQRLHLLQMAAEKVCKAYLHDGGNPVIRSHAVVEKYLPLIYRNLNGVQAVSGTEFNRIRRLAKEIELLAPACDAMGSRPDNTEYPWEDARGFVQTPVDYSFPEIDEDDRGMTPLLRALGRAAEQFARGKP